MRVLAEALLLERQLEQAKCDLAAQEDFTLIDCFRLFDPNWRGHLTLQELREAFFRNTNQYAFREDDIALIFGRFDKDKDGRLRYSEFADMMQPLSMEYRKSLLERRSGYCKFSHRTLDFLHKLLLTHLKVAEGLEQLRRRLYKKREKYVLNKMFKDLDPSRKGYLSSHDLGSILAYSRKLKIEQ